MRARRPTGPVGREAEWPEADAGGRDRWTVVHRTSLGRDPPGSDPVRVNRAHGGGEVVGARVAPTWLPRRPAGRRKGEEG